MAERTTSKKKLCSFVPNMCHNHTQNKVGLTALSARDRSPKHQTMSSFTYPHVVPNLNDFLLEKYILKNTEVQTTLDPINFHCMT